MVESYCLETHFWSKQGVVYTGVAMPTNLAAQKELEEIVDNCHVADKVILSGEERKGDIIYCKGAYDSKTRKKLTIFVDKYKEVGAYQVTGNYFDLLSWDWLEKALRFK